MKTVFVKVCSMLLFLPALSHAQGIRQSEFNTTLDTFWIFVDPRGGCTQSMTDSHAVIDIPLGLSRDPVSSGQGGNRTPRLVQRVGAPGSDVGDFGIYAKFDGVQTRQYQIQGVMAIQDDKNYVRCEIYSDSSGLRALLYTFDNDGNYASRKDHLLEGVPLGTTPLLVRLDRTDSVFTQYYKTSEGGPWIKVDTAIHHMNVDSVAVYAANSDSLQPPGDTSAPAFTGLVDYFRTEAPLPVQLASFSARLAPDNLVRLDWMTISETNNYGFEVQKRLGEAGTFQTIENSFVPGHGTTLEPHWYTFTDPTTTPGDWRYRLKQIDLDATVHYSEPIAISVPTGVDNTGEPAAFMLEQNYPNPFNPSTTIGFSVPDAGIVSLKVFDVLGREVATLVNEVRQPGQHSVTWNASNAPSGVYFYRLDAAGLTQTRHMVLMK